MAESPPQPSFYAPWPLFGKAINKQWTELRQNHESLNPLIRAAGVSEAASDFRLDALQSWEVGETGFHNKYRIYWDNSDTSFKIQRNSGTEASPTWVTVLAGDSSGQLTDANGDMIPSAGGTTIAVRDTLGLDSYTGIDTLSFLQTDFYITQGTDTTEAIINFKGTSGGGGGSGTITGGTSLGGDADVFESTVAPNLRFRGITGGDGITVAEGASAITITSAGASLGGDVDIFDAADSDSLNFKGLTAGSGIVLTDNSTFITIESLAGDGFYGSTVAQTDGLVSFSGIEKFNFNRDDGFYITQNAPNTDEVTINLSGLTGPQGPTGATGADGADGADGGAIGTYTESPTGIEWQVTHSLNSSILLWSAFDDANEYIIPQKVDTSNPNIAYFYFNESIAGHVILSAGSPTAGGGGGGSGFYGVTLKHSDDSESFSGNNVIGVDPAYFYIHRNPGQGDEAHINFRFTGNETIPGRLNLFNDDNPSTAPEDGDLNIIGAAVKRTRISNTSTAGSTRIAHKIANRLNEDWRWIVFTDSASDGTDDIQLNKRDPITMAAVPVVLVDEDSQIGIGTTTPQSTLDVNGTMDVRGTSRFHKRASGFYLPWMEDVGNNAPVDEDVLVFDSATGVYQPGAAPIDVYQSSGTPARRTTRLSFNRDHFYITPTSQTGETQVNRIPQIPYRSNVWSVNYPQDGDIISGPYVNGDVFGQLTFDRINASINAAGGSETAHWTLYAGSKKDGSDKRVITGEITSAQTTVATTTSFYINSISNKFIWLDVAEIVGTVTELMVEAIYTTGGNG